MSVTNRPQSDFGFVLVFRLVKVFILLEDSGFDPMRRLGVFGFDLTHQFLGFVFAAAMIPRFKM